MGSEGDVNQIRGFTVDADRVSGLRRHVYGMHDAVLPVPRIGLLDAPGLGNGRFGRPRGSFRTFGVKLQLAVRSHRKELEIGWFDHSRTVSIVLQGMSAGQGCRTRRAKRVGLARCRHLDRHGRPDFGGWYNSMAHLRSSPVKAFRRPVPRFAPPFQLHANLAQVL